MGLAQKLEKTVLFDVFMRKVLKSEAFSYVFSCLLASTLSGSARLGTLQGMVQGPSETFEKH